MIQAFVLVMAFWTASADYPVKSISELFKVEKDCLEYAEKLSQSWDIANHGGNTSWACLTAVKAPST